MLHTKRGFLALTILMTSCLSQAMMQRQLTLVHENNNFRVESEEGSFPIQRCYMDKELRGISPDKLAKFATAGAYLQLNKFENSSDYTLRLNGRLNGGGLLGANAGFYTGKFLVNLAGHGTIVIISAGTAIVGGPAAGLAMAAALEKTFALPIEAASNVVGLGTGIAGAVVTGPA